MNKAARSITNWTSGVAAVTSFIAQPIPVLDEAAVIPMHYYLVWRLARTKSVSMFKLPWRDIQRVIWYGAGARLATHFVVGMVPVAGGFANAITAIALTEYLSRYLDAVLDDAAAKPPILSFAALRALFERATQRFHAEQQANSHATEGGAA